MSQLPVNATGLSRRELRKAVIRLRLKCSASNCAAKANCWCNPSARPRGWATTSASNCSAVAMRRSGAPAGALLGVLLGKGGRWQRLLRLGVALAPLLLGLRAERPLKDAPTGNGRRLPNATIELAEANR